MERRVVISGIGVVSPVGIGKDDFWQSISSGVCGIDRITRFDTSAHKAKLAAEIREFDPTLYMDKKDARRSDLYCQFALAAAKLCMDDSALDVSAVDPSRVGVIVGSGVGGLGTMETQHSILLEKGPGRVSPFFIPMMVANIASGMISMLYGFTGVSYCPVSACSTGAHAIGEAYRTIKHGYADFILAGGAEAAITPISLAGFSNMTALSEADDPALGSLPFDKRRTGFVMGEGAGVVLLETYESAVARGAEIYCEVLGYGATSDAHHITAPHPEGKGGEAAMRAACREAGVDRVDYINAHGTGTPLNDAIETLAIRRVFPQPPPVSSTKSMTGHLLGAAGGVESIVCALALTHGVLPPTIHYAVPDENCDLDVVPNEARQAPIKTALSNSLGFGGHNVSLLFGKVDR